MANVDQQILTMLATMMSEQTLDAELTEGIGKMFDLNPVIQDQYLEAATCEEGQLIDVEKLKFSWTLTTLILKLR